MASELQASFQTGKTLYVLIRNANGRVWNTGSSTFDVYASASFSSYTVNLTEQGTSGYYAGDFPTAITTAGTYQIVVKNRLGGAPAETDPTVGTQEVGWNGSGVLTLTDLATSGLVGQYLPQRISRGVMLQNFPFKLVSNADHVTNFTSGVVSGQISRDGGAFGALQSGAFTEVGLGFYKVTLTSGDLNANTVALSFSAVGVSGGTADQRDFTFVLQRVSGQTIT